MLGNTIFKRPPITNNIDNNQFNYINKSLNKSNKIEEIYESKYNKFNSPKEYLRPTINIFPKSEIQMNQLSVPIGLIISPTSSFAQEGDIPILNYGENNDVPRCKNEKCKAFINPYVKFVNNSENWECNLCKCIKKTEDYYFKYIDNNGMSINKDTKIELNNGTYEYILNKSYWKNDRIPNTPIYYFLIDISYKAVQSGFSQCILETIKDCINNNYFYGYEIFNIKICIITYDNSIHFYSVNPNASQFTMLSVNDQDIFIPTNKNNLLINLKENKNKIIQIIESIQNFLLNQNIEIKEATKTFDAIKSVNLLGGILGGKVLLFSGSNVNLLEEMNDPKDNEDDKNINQNLERGAKKLSQLGIKLTYNNFSVDVFQSCNEFIKLLSLNQLCDNSNGNIFFYKNFNPEIHYKNIYNQIKRVLTNEMQLEGTLKLRFSNGYYIKEYMTSVLLYNRRLFVFPCHDVDQKYSVLLSILTQEELEENELTNKFDDYIYIQSCLLFSQGDGTRRIRVHNLCLPVSSNNKDIFESIDVECLSAFYAQKLIHLIYRTRNLTNSVIQIENNFYSLINEYFNNSNSLKRELNSKMQLFILYFLGILKLNLFNRNNDKGYLNDIDLSNYFRLRLLRSNVEEIIVFIYPRIYILDECIELKKGEFPEIINDSIEFFNKGNLFLIDNGFYFILYFKKNIYNIICQDIFGVNSFDEINYFEVNESTIFDNDNNYGKYKMKISEIINGLRSTKSLFQDLYFVFEGINDENIFKELLIENNYNKTYPFDYNTFYDKIISGNYK